MLISNRRQLCALITASALFPASGQAQTTNVTAQSASVPMMPMESSRPVARLGGLNAIRLSYRVLERAVDAKGLRPPASSVSGHPASRVQQPVSQRKRSWIGRHPVLFGALAGFVGGFLIGYLPGDDAVFEDFDAEFNGWVLGGAGAGAGALAGAIIGVATK